VSAEAFQVFVSALGGTDPALAMENMNDLLLLSEEFGFASLLSQVTAFISANSVVDGEARRRVNDLEERNRQQKRKYSLLQKETVDLREVKRRRSTKLSHSAARKQSQTKK
jgi:hypothetical protein